VNKYNRRDFLRSMGAALAVVGGAASVPNVLVSRAASRSNPAVEFPWSFYGETELTSAPGEAGMENATLHMIEASDPPVGFKFFARSLRVLIAEDARLHDAQKLLDGWALRVVTGTQILILAPMGRVISGCGMQGTKPPSLDRIYPPSILMCPQLPLTMGTLSVMVHGRPFPLTGPPIKIQAMISGIGIQSEAEGVEAKPC
jgi:hypothetical protein